MTIENAATATDSFSATVTSVDKGVASAVTSAAHVVPALKAKASELHNVLGKAAHLGEVAWDDVERVVADLRWLITFGRSKTPPPAPTPTGA